MNVERPQSNRHAGISSDRPVIDGAELNKWFLLCLRLPGRVQLGEIASCELRLEASDIGSFERADLLVFDDHRQLLSSNRIRRPIHLKDLDKSSAPPLRPIPLHPRKAGGHILRFQLVLKDDAGYPTVLWSYTTIQVARTASDGAPVHIHMHAPNVQKDADILSGEGARKLGVDEHIDIRHQPVVNIRNDHQDGVGGAVDSQSLTLNFFFDREQTERELLNFSTHCSLEKGLVVRPLAPRTPTPPAEREYALPGAALLEAKVGERLERFILFTRDSVQIGRGFDSPGAMHGNDLIVAPAPYDDPKRWQARSCISRVLGRLTFRDGRLFFQKASGRGGPLTLNQTPVPDGDLEIGHDAVLSIADLIDYHFHFIHDVDNKDKDYPDILDALRNTLSDLDAPCEEKRCLTPEDLFGLTAGHTVRVIRMSRCDHLPVDPPGLHPGADSTPSSDKEAQPDLSRWRETVCLVFKEARIGSSPSLAIPLRAEGVQPIHGRILFHDGRFYFQSQSGAQDLWIDDTPVMEQTLYPLEFGHRLRIGSVECRFGPFDNEAGFPE